MGFFKDFKEDFNDAVNELIPGGEELPVEDDIAINTLEGDIDVDGELSKLDGLLEEVAKKVDAPKSSKSNSEFVTDDTAIKEPVITPAATVIKSEVKEEKKMDTTTTTVTPEVTPAFTPAPKVSDENGVITAGMTIKGSIESIGSVEVQGIVDGDVTCNGKLVITGRVTGNTTSAEFFADAAKVEGEIHTNGTAKVGAGSVVIGNIQATSAVIAGAVKGDIDVQGPVVVDTSAVIMGNIKSRSVQINNGAVIEGFCSQAYSEIDVQGIFNN